MEDMEYNAELFNEFVGKTWGTDVTENILRKKGQFNSVRVIGPDDMVTMDYQQSRLNVNVDEKRVILSFNFS